MHILSFLVSFDANLFALDNEQHTAMDVAASRDRMECVRFLDAAASQQTNQNPKRVARLKKEAAREAEKRVKICEKVKRRHQSKMDKMYRGVDGAGSASEGGDTLASSSVGAATGVDEHFSKFIASDKSGSLSARLKGTLQKKLGKKDTGTLQRDANVIFLKQEDAASENAEFLDIFDERDERMLQDEGELGYGDDDDESAGQVKQSIFNRPGLGGLIFMKRMSLDTDDVAGGNNENLGYLVENDKIEGEEDLSGFEGNADTEVPWEQDDLGLDEEEEETSPLDAFLSSVSLPEFALAFTREHLDLEALMLCSDQDLKGIRIQLGPRKKILEAVARRKNALARPGALGDSGL
ncbi:ankyrin repeat and SAM domain-containing protein 4B isoform X2 [Syngnathus acus]|nr:ankyrin repeat and SAM domain-containing protein 4B isoform X2 [Syngnathus acus]